MAANVSQARSAVGHDRSFEQFLQIQQFSESGRDGEVTVHHRDIGDGDGVRTKSVDIRDIYQPRRPPAKEPTLVESEADDG